MKRIAWIAAAAALAACNFPEVPRGAEAGIRPGQTFQPIARPSTPPEYGIGAEVEGNGAPERLGRPRELHGKLVGNAVSSFVIQTEDQGVVTVQVTPQTMLRIGNVEAGLREIQPGTEVRAMSVPTTDGRIELAVEVVAEPETVGWQRAPNEFQPSSVQRRVGADAADELEAE